MSDATRIVDELTRAVEGDPWHGTSLQAILEGVTAADAARRPIPNAHTIWELVRHLTAWTGEVNRRLAGHPPGDPQEGDWPAPSGTSEAAWRDDVRALFEAHRRVLASVASQSDAALHAPPGEARDRPTGSGVSRYVLLHGLAQHHAYHGGQIALLKKQAA
jgi:hypothetical protein